MRGPVTMNLPKNGFVGEFDEPNPHLGWILAGHQGFPTPSNGAQTWRFQGAEEIQIHDDFQSFKVVMQVYHLTLQVHMFAK